MAVYNSCYRTTRKETREMVTERRIYSEIGKFGNQSLCQTLSKAFDMSSDTAKDSPKCRRAEGRGPRVREKRKKITRRAFLTKPILAIRDKISRIKMFPNLHVKDRFENFREYGGQRNGTVFGGLRGIPLLRHRLNESTFPA